MELIVENLKCVRDACQAVVVTTEDYNEVSAVLQSFEKVRGIWKRVFPPMQAVIGENGFACNKVEGDGKSPIGIYTFGTCFGKYLNPGTMLPYRQTTKNDFWVDDSDSCLYNTWQIGPPMGRWKSAEVLYPDDSIYDYAVVINYNTIERIPGKGSAIFLHIWESPQTGTLGCTAVEKSNLLKILRWLNPFKNPLIIEGPVFEVLKW